MTTTPDLQSGITRDIYGMPTFVSLVVPDIRAAAAWSPTHSTSSSRSSCPPATPPVLIHLRRWRYHDLRVRRAQTDHQQAAAPITGGSQVSFAAAYDELDALAERARHHGAVEVTGPGDTTWNTRDLKVTTPQGLRLVFTARRPEPLRDATFAANIYRWIGSGTPAARFSGREWQAGEVQIDLYWDHNAWYQARLLRALPVDLDKVLDVWCGAGSFAARLRRMHVMSTRSTEHRRWSPWPASWFRRTSMSA